MGARSHYVQNNHNIRLFRGPHLSNYLPDWLKSWVLEPLALLSLIDHQRPRDPRAAENGRLLRHEDHFMLVGVNKCKNSDFGLIRGGTPICSSGQPNHQCTDQPCGQLAPPQRLRGEEYMLSPIVTLRARLLVVYSVMFDACINF